MCVCDFFNLILLSLKAVFIFRGANLLAVNADGNMPYDICEDEQALDYIEAEMARRGVTQDLIDDTRAATENQMLHDLQLAAALGHDLETPDHQGATPVIIYYILPLKKNYPIKMNFLFWILIF